MSECAKGVSVGSQNLPKSANERFKKVAFPLELCSSVSFK